MPTWAEIRRWRPEVIAEVGDHLAAQRNLVVGLQDELDGSVPAGWSGDSADAARADLRQRRQDLEDLAARLSAAVQAVDETEQSVQSLVRDADAFDDIVIRHGLRIENGLVVGAANGFVAIVALQAHVQHVLVRAAAIDEELRSVLQRVLSGEIGDGGAASLADAARAGEDRIADERRHRDLLARYQVRTDDTTVWPGGLGGWLLERVGISPQRVTDAEASMLDDLQARKGALGLKEFADIRQDALHEAESRFDGEGLTDGHADAFRHAYWNALMAQRYGEQWAGEFATAHERNPSSHAVPVAMDLHNNEVGRAIARENPNASPEELATLIENAVRDCRMVVVDSNDTLVPSDEVDPGETRDSRTPWPTNNPDRADDRDPGDPTATPDRY